jgi:hypothetical protein
MYRVTDVNALGVEVKRWERAGADHWAHSYCYARVGMDKFGMGGGEVVSSSTDEIVKDIAYQATDAGILIDDTKNFVESYDSRDI